MVGGLDKQIKEIKEVIELPVKHPELFEALGIAQPKGVLLYGPPGTGKTLLARAVAHHTDCTFIRVSGSELVQKFIGEGSRMVRELFVMAREHAPSIIFMDEIDSIGSARLESGGSGGGDSEVQRTMLELLNQLDGFEATKNIKVIMATNRIDILDSALLRPGRIDRKIEFPPPNEGKDLTCYPYCFCCRQRFRLLFPRGCFLYSLVTVVLEVVGLFRNNCCNYFLDLFSHLYKRLCPSVRRSVRPSHKSAISEILDILAKMEQNSIENMKLNLLGQFGNKHESRSPEG